VICIIISSFSFLFFLGKRGNNLLKDKNYGWLAVRITSAFPTMNRCLDVGDALAFDKPCSKLRIPRVPTLIFLTRCTRALERGEQIEGLRGSEGGSISWVVQAGGRELVHFVLLCVE